MHVPTMALPQSLILLVLAAFSGFASAQQGVLATGLPACAQQCTLLLQAAAACGGQATVGPTTWNCFCQSGYLKPLYSSPTGVCDTACTAPADNTNVMNWYKSNCGTDFGATEHPAGQAAAPSTTGSAPVASTSTAAPAKTSAPAKSGSGSTNAGVTSDPNANKSWLDTHYKWVIFLVVTVVGFIIVTIVAVWWKRRYYRNRDQIHGGFNTGVSEHVAPMSVAAYNNSGNLGGVGSGANSPQRTRDAFMPYGYNYSRSETHLASQTNIPESYRQSPLARGGTPADDGQRAVAGPSDPLKQSKRTLVRERSTQGPETPPV